MLAWTARVNKILCLRIIITMTYNIFIDHTYYKIANIKNYANIEY